MNQTSASYLVLSARQRSVPLTSLAQSAHVLYMSPFTLCLHLAYIPQAYVEKTGEICVVVSVRCVFFFFSRAEFCQRDGSGYEAE